jgi:hypothetical protein
VTFADHTAQRQAAQDQIEAAEEECLEWEDLYDSEKIEVREVYRRLQESTGHRELSGFQREVRERFAEIGIEARCDFYEDVRDKHLEGVQIPRITLIKRIERREEFDHDQMGHEVRSNILGTNKQGNVQKTQVAPGWGQSGSGLIVPK